MPILLLSLTLIAAAGHFDAAAVPLFRRCGSASFDAASDAASPLRRADAPCFRRYASMRA